MPRSKRVTIADIARQAGVSPGAVSFALNGRPGVSEETRQRILAIADQHDWRPSSTARALVGAHAGVIGFAVNRPARTLGTEAFFTDLIAGVQSSLAARRIGMQLVVVPTLEEELDTYRRWRRANQVDGVLVLDPRVDDPRPELLRTLGLPSITIGGQPSPDGEHATLWLDDSAAAETVFGYLARLGHRHIVYISGAAAHEHVRLRRGVLDAMSARGVRGEVVETDYSPSQVSTVMRSLLSRAELPTAVVFDNDMMAIAGLRVTQEMGVRVPGELSLASFDDSIVTGLVHPSITCLTRDTFLLGERAADFLLEQLDASEVLPDRMGPVPTLTVRESTGRPQG
ncbi:LacI family DNA-binding transcriptional regulator [Microbacterium esteraromaticum]|uniref:LacI family DNA-binding transcriptional regulator n=1 Tax=Microbacterium esteraromaticum TaxID=57043 RepID=UPI00195DF100|nr:LacI family DNA-binding transcriptional regulator [Microbacterium esteraromaticum]MBM7465776.1 DNA-binding LacI/PurR family transcriptional regulator [Microbacterium esteraromaticum]